jgi:hypothetical protein
LTAEPGKSQAMTAPPRRQHLLDADGCRALMTLVMAVAPVALARLRAYFQKNQFYLRRKKGCFFVRVQRLGKNKWRTRVFFRAGKRIRIPLDPALGGD